MGGLGARGEAFAELGHSVSPLSVSPESSNGHQKEIEDQEVTVAEKLEEREQEKPEPLTDEARVQWALDNDPGYRALVEEVGQLLEGIPGEADHDFVVQVHLGLLESRRVIIDRFERTDKRENRLPFHNWAHTQGVIRRVLTMARTIHHLTRHLPKPVITRRVCLVAALDAAYHDTVQEWQYMVSPNDPETGLMNRTRLRDIDKNEAASYRLLQAHMVKANSQHPDRPIFSLEEMRDAELAHRATVPAWNPELSTVTQRYLAESKGRLVPQLTALADLGTAGMEPERYGPEGDDLFREDNLDILAIITDTPQALLLSEEDLQAYPAEYRDQVLTWAKETKQRFLNRMLGWAEIQVKFARGRRQRILGDPAIVAARQAAGEPLRIAPDSELYDLKAQLIRLGANEAAVDEQLLALFNGFDQAIEAAEAALQYREALATRGAFWTLAQDMGYNVPAEYVRRETEASATSTA